ncbi:MAG: hypothetical protein RL213_2061 [Bacteroidota bacterium]|jgi:hypothetical protein
MVFYLSIVLYIASTIAALVLMITARHWPLRRFLLLSGIHLCFAGLYLVTSGGQTDESSYNFHFLLYICTGTSLSGLAWRIKAPLPLRLYFSVFTISFPLFLFSPSMLVNFLLTTRYSDTMGKTFSVKDDIYLEQEQAWRKSGNPATYKLVERKGLFRKALSRGLDFGSTVDSVKTIEFIPDSIAHIRTYRITETYVSSRTDSFDLTIDLRPKTANRIERRLTP